MYCTSKNSYSKLLYIQYCVGQNGFIVVPKYEHNSSYNILGKWQLVSNKPNYLDIIGLILTRSVGS